MPRPPDGKRALLFAIAAYVIGIGGIAIPIILDLPLPDDGGASFLGLLGFTTLGLSVLGIIGGWRAAGPVPRNRGAALWAITLGLLALPGCAFLLIASIYPTPGP